MCSVTKSTFDVMVANDIQLEHYGFLIDNNESIEETFALIQVAQSTSTMSSLEIICNHGTNALDFSQNLIDLCLSLKSLTSLKLLCYSDNIPILIVDVTQNLTSLRSVDLKGITIIDEDTTDDLLYNKLSNAVQMGRLESFNFTYDTDTSISVAKSNHLFAFILQSCPHLKEFDLSTFDNNFDARGDINLDFRRNLSLRYIGIDMSHCRYYTFSHHFGKYWREHG